MYSRGPLSYRAGPSTMQAKCARPDQILSRRRDEFAWERVDETRRSEQRFPPTAADGVYNQADQESDGCV